MNELAERTHGDIYIGVVGPVRVGKSTLISKLMEHLVLPLIEDDAERARMIDEMPQSSAGLEIMTTEPKFVPATAASVPIQGSDAHMKLRFVDCVGYMIDSIANPDKMIQTPWHETPIPFQQAARLGTDKVIRDHSTIGIVVTGDGTVNGLQRSQIEQAEMEIVEQLQTIGKPFLLIINSESPFSETTLQLAETLEQRYQVPVEAASIKDLTKERLDYLLQRVLFEFPIEHLELEAPEWVTLDQDNIVVNQIQDILHTTSGQIQKLKDVDQVVEEIKQLEYIDHASLIDINPASGEAVIQFQVSDELFQLTCEKWLPAPIQTKSDYLKLIQNFYHANQTYEKFAEGIQEAIETGYGVALPHQTDFVPYAPELIKENNFHGVRLRAKAPVIHLIRVDMTSEFSPLLGSEFHSNQLKKELQEHFETDLNELWKTQLFGTTLIHVLQEGIKMKTENLTSPVKNRLAKTIEKLVRQEEKGLITFIL